MAGIRIIGLEEGWNFMQIGITKLKSILEADYPKPRFTCEQQMMLYTIIYNMCTQHPPNNHSQQLYVKYRETFEEYITSVVLPSLREKHDDGFMLLSEFVKRWSNHKVMVRLLSRVFEYLDRYFTHRKSLPRLKEVGLACFHDLVYSEMKGKVRDAVISLIEQEREGEQIDHTLLKNAVDMFVEIGKGGMEYYENDFESFMLKETSAYYSRKAAYWILDDSCPDYMLKAEECLKREKNSGLAYLHASSAPKLLEIVQHELLSVYATQLLEKESCHALFKDDKVVHLSRMYRLFSMLPRGLDAVSSMFKQYVTAEGTALVKQAEDAASDKEIFVRKVIELHDKCWAYINVSFNNHTLFYKALKNAFELFCNKGVAGISVAELLVTFCDNILKKNGSEKLSDETVEDTLEKVAKLLALYISDKDLFAAFYREKLARRLLFDMSANDEHERIMLTKLKQQCGDWFTSKMEGMATDLALEKENRSHFEEYLASNSNVSRGIDLDERKKVIEDVVKDRWYAVDASILRIMKSKKVLGYQQLVIECAEQLGHMFRPDAKTVKERIENLITRDYLERDKGNRNVFRYLA